MLDKIKLRGYLYKKLIKKKEKQEKDEPKDRIEKMLSIAKDTHSSGDMFDFKTKSTVFSAPITKSERGMIYPLIRPYTYVKIKWDSIERDYIYHIIEPKLSQKEENVMTKIKEGLIQTIDVSLEKIKNKEKVGDFLEDKVKSLLKDFGLEIPEPSYNRLMYYVFRDFVGLNEIEPVLRDPFIEDISCDGVGSHIFVVHKKHGSLKTNISFDNLDELKDFVVKLSERCGRYISYAEPLLDGTLPDGTRIQASLAGDVTTKGPTFSIRKFPERPMTPPDLVSLGTATSEMLAYLWLLVENGSNILIGGGTASGKTTFLNAISLFINPESKIVSIEDTRELSLQHENWIPGVSRKGFAGTDVGEVSMYDLLKESFRQNPDYLIVGEVRGEEAAIMFQGMASGHIGLSTMHAGSVDDIVKRLITRPINLPPSLVETLDIVVIMSHIKHSGKSIRRAKEIVEIIGEESGNIKTNNAFEWDASKDSFDKLSAKNTKILKKISQERGTPVKLLMKDMKKRRDLLEKIRKSKIDDWKRVAEIISVYQRNPDEAFEMVK